MIKVKPARKKNAQTGLTGIAFGLILLWMPVGLVRLQAQESPHAPTVSSNGFDLAQCQAIARQKNRGLRIAQNNLASALEGGRIAESDVFAPKLDVSQTFTEQNDLGEARVELDYLSPLGIEFSPFITESSNQNRDEPRSSNIGITLKHRIFSAAERWRLRLPLTGAERSLLQAQNNLQLRTRELDFTILRSFLAVQRAENRIRVRRDRVVDAKAFLKVTEERVLNGLAPKVDIANAEINLNQAEADLLSEETALRNQTESLLNVMGVAVTNDLAITPYRLDQRTNETFDLVSDSTNLLARHETLVNAKLNLAFAEVEIKIQKDLLRPRFDLSFTAEHQSEGAELFNEQDENADPYRFLVTYTTALDGKKRDKARLAQLEFARENLEAGLKDDEHRLLLSLRSAQRSIGQLKIQVGLNKQRLEAERARLAATLVRYEDGNVDNLEVTRAKQTVDNAEINLINTNIDLVLAEEEYKSLLPPKKPVQTELTPP